MEKILVSGCLMGQRVRYDGRDKLRDDELLNRWRAEGRLVSCCPEVGGGLPVPRRPAEITGAGGGPAVLDGTARVLTDTGEDVTDAFLLGAHRALETARQANARLAVLKESSPSCGSTRIYDGAFTGHLSPGTGVTTALLERHGIRVFSETALSEAAAYLHRLETAHPTP
ncbi:Uncharacterized conserved protein YbbK, DUF523 family [Thermomonospora echinospora]|uniref:Uncharacterized conserved protein YbbK, DUF523 family n=1 Tax=Thermomonospora echinospora TaxID=1992 RepID=A0A1H6EBI9_9ACTN|nr:DUF523 domain-containing protein [Thermomonospora echinospora]SEG94633.1 Uncharacterized conserved protein YbbK, DUF523 family [Thermomonospora echinospora]